MSNENEVLVEFLKSLGIKELTKNEKKILAELILERKNLDVVKRELELLYSLNRVLIESYSTVSMSNMMKIYNDIDSELLIELFMAYNQIRAKAYDNKTAVYSFRKTCEKILANNKKVNFVINKLVSEEISKIDSIRNVLYFGMLDTEKADKLFLNCRKRSKHFLNNCDVENLSLLVDCLKKDYNLSDDELVEISSKCATFFAFSSAGKIHALDKVTSEFKDFISVSLRLEGKSSKVSELLGRDFKDVIVNSSTFLTSNIDQIKDTIRFLKGESLTNINRSIDVKGSFTPLQLAKIYNESITSLTTSVDKISNLCINISSVYKDVYGEELDLKEFINGRNFASISQLRNEDFDNHGKLKEILGILKPFVNAKEMKNLMANNLSFLIADTIEVKTSLKNAILNSRNNDELKINVLSKIKNHFDRNDGYDFSLNSNNKTSLTVEKAKKVILNDLDEQGVVDILSRLSVTNEELNGWRENWKDEAKELRDLQLQIDLEDVIESLDSLEEMIDDGYTSVENFIQETMVIKKLYEEILNRHEEIILNNKLTKKFKSLDETIQTKMASITKKIDNNIEKIISLYKDNVSDLTLMLDVANNDKNRYERIKRQLDVLEDEILKEDISEESLKLQEEEIKEIERLIKDAQKREKTAIKIENAASDSVEKFYDVLCDKKISEIAKLGKEVNNDYADARYMFELFVHVLVKEDLVYDDGALDEDGRYINPRDQGMEYQRYRTLLNDRQRLVADQIYNAYIQSSNDKGEIFDELCYVLEDYDVDISEINTIKKAVGALFKVMNCFKEKYGAQKTMLNNQRLSQSNLSKLDIKGIKAQIAKLEEEISIYNSKIEGLKNQKILKRKI